MSAGKMVVIVKTGPKIWPEMCITHLYGHDLSFTPGDFQGRKKPRKKRVEKLAVKSGTFSGLKTFKGENFHATNT